MNRKVSDQINTNEKQRTYRMFRSVFCELRSLLEERIKSGDQLPGYLNQFFGDIQSCKNLISEIDSKILRIDSHLKTGGAK